MIIFYDELPDLSKGEKKHIDSLTPVNVWWNNMKEKHKISGKKWAKKKAAERAAGIYK